MAEDRRRIVNPFMSKIFDGSVKDKLQICTFPILGPSFNLAKVAE